MSRRRFVTAVCLIAYKGSFKTFFVTSPLCHHLYSRSCGANFTTQLEKARESTDAADIRDYYAEISTSLLTGDLNATTTECQVGNNLTAAATYSTAGVLEKVVVSGWTAHQTQENWQSGEQTIAGCTIAENTNFKGATTITYTFSPSTDGDMYVSAIAP